MPREMRWVARYANGEVLREHERGPNGWIEHSFYAIRTREVVQFGLEGAGLSVGFCTTDGRLCVPAAAHAAPAPLHMRLIGRDGHIVALTGRDDVDYRDLIQYKDAYLDLAAGAFGAGGTVSQYNVGYKCRGYDDALGAWWLQLIAHVPAEERRPLWATVRLTIDRGFVGHFQLEWGAKIRRVESILPPLRAHELAITFV